MAGGNADNCCYNKWKSSKNYWYFQFISSLINCQAKHPSQLTASVSKMKDLLLSGSCHFASLKKRINCLSAMKNGNRVIIFSYYWTTLLRYLLMLLELVMSTSELHFFSSTHTESSCLWLRSTFFFRFTFLKITVHLTLLSLCTVMF